MLEDIVQNGEVSKEDKEFIDMTHRNTELLEENKQLKEKLALHNGALKREHEAIHRANDLEDRINKAIEYINSEDICIDIRKTDGSMDYVSEEELLEILKGE